MKASIIARYHRRVLPLAAAVLVATACGFTSTLARAQNDDLVTAAKRGDLPAVNALLKSGADVNDRGYTQSGTTTALMEASFNGHLDVVQALLAAKADVNATRSEKKDRETALSLAVQKNHVEVARALLAANADVNHACCNATALYEAVRLRNLDMVNVLLAAKADVNRPEKIGTKTPLMFAISGGGDWEMARLLLEAGANVNMSTNKGVTALTLAVQGNSPENLATVEALLAAGADVNHRICAVIEESPTQLVSYARAYKATALGVASSMGNAAVVRALLAAKADVNLSQCDGKTPLMLALENRRQEVAELLRSAIATAGK